MNTNLKIIVSVLMMQFSCMISAQVGDSDTERDIVALIDQYSNARNTGNTNLLEQILTVDIDQVASSGSRRVGREEAITYMMRSSSNNPGNRTLDVERVRLLSSNSAIADAIYNIHMADGSVRSLMSTFVVVQDQGKWRIAAIRNMLPDK